MPISLQAPPPRRRPNKEMPNALKDELSQIHRWADENSREASQDSWKFWMLKLPAIVISASSGLTAYLGLSTLGVVSASVASALILIDAVLRPGKLRDVHHLAQFELRTLADEIMGEWSSKVLRNRQEPELIAALLLERIQKERRRVANYLKRTETSAIVTSD